MARGFESKQVEFQQEEAARTKTRRPQLSDGEKAALIKRSGLELARARAVADLDRAKLPAHRRMLEQAISALDAELSQTS